MKYSLFRHGQPAAPLAAALGVIVLGVIALATSLPADASPLAVRQAGGPATTGQRRAVVIDNCGGHRELHPRELVLTCADANDYLTGLRWVSWRSVAYASGIEQINNCEPSCAAGQLDRYRVLVTLWRPEPQGGRAGLLHFTRLTELYPGRRPPVFSRHDKMHHPRAVTRHL